MTIVFFVGTLFFDQDKKIVQVKWYLVILDIPTSPKPQSVFNSR